MTDGKNNFVRILTYVETVLVDYVVSVINVWVIDHIYAFYVFSSFLLWFTIGHNPFKIIQWKHATTFYVQVICPVATSFPNRSSMRYMTQLYVSLFKVACPHFLVHRKTIPSYKLGPFGGLGVQNKKILFVCLFVVVFRL